MRITRPLSTATPESAMKPTAAETDIGMPRSQSAATPPESASGTALKTSTRVARAAERRIEQQEDQDEARRHDDREPCARRGEILELPAPGQPIAGRQRDFRGDLGLRLGDDRGDVASAHIGGDDDAALAVLARDLVLPFADRDLGDLLQQDRRRRAGARPPAAAPECSRATEFRRALCRRGGS